MTGAFDKQVGGNYYKDYKIQPYKFFFVNDIEHSKAAVIRRILRYNKPGGKGLLDLEKIQHECDLLKELNNYKLNLPLGPIIFCHNCGDKLRYKTSGGPGDAWVFEITSNCSCFGKQGEVKTVPDFLRKE